MTRFTRVLPFPVVTSHDSNLKINHVPPETQVEQTVKMNRYKGVFTPSDIVSCQSLHTVPAKRLSQGENYKVKPTVELSGRVAAYTSLAGGLFGYFGNKPSVWLNVTSEYTLFSGGLGNPRKNFKSDSKKVTIININNKISNFVQKTNPTDLQHPRTPSFAPPHDRDLYLHVNITLTAYLEGDCYINFSGRWGYDSFTIKVPEVQLMDVSG